MTIVVVALVVIVGGLVVVITLFGVVLVVFVVLVFVIVVVAAASAAIACGVASNEGATGNGDTPDRRKPSGQTLQVFPSPNAAGEQAASSASHNAAAGGGIKITDASFVGGKGRGGALLAVRADETARLAALRFAASRADGGQAYRTGPTWTTTGRLSSSRRSTSASRAGEASRTEPDRGTKLSEGAEKLTSPQHPDTPTLRPRATRSSRSHFMVSWGETGARAGSTCAAKLLQILNEKETEEKITNMLNSFRTRCEICVERNGAHTGY